MRRPLCRLLAVAVVFIPLALTGTLPAADEHGEIPPPAAEPKPPKHPVTSPILTIKLALMNDERLFPYDIDVDMKGETVELSGKVPSDAERRAAAEIAQRIEGVKAVKNELEIAKDLAAATGKRRDELITQYVRERFSKSKTLEGARFDIKTHDGVVSLAGKTRFQVIVLEAAEAARQVPGVKAVNTDAIQLEGS